ncbi:MAG: class I SAM-dependent methyltransferase [Acidimicrobiales bacterium]
MLMKDRLKSLPPLYWAARTARTAVRELMPPKQLAGVPGRIHANDLMMPKRVPEQVADYVAAGEQIAALIGQHLAQSVRDDGGTGLDLGCGHGRVLRHLVTAFPEVRWTGADIDRSALRFCRNEFGVETVLASRQPARVRLTPGPYDIVWMGSLLTHLDNTSEHELWNLIHRNVRPGALLVFSTIGPSSVDWLPHFLPNGHAHIDSVAAELTRSGHAHVPYPHYRRAAYGITLHTAEYLDDVIKRSVATDARRLAYAPRAWLGAQDLHVYRLGALLASSSS